MFGFEPDPAYRYAPFHPEAVNAFIARLVWHDDGRIEAGFLPVYVEAPGRPVIADSRQARAVSDYVGSITAEAGLPPLEITPRADMDLVTA